MSFFKILTLLAALLSTVHLIADDCGNSNLWVTPAAGMAPVTLSQAIDQLARENQVVVEKSDIQARCGSTYDYTVQDFADKSSLGVVPVPHIEDKQNDGRSLLLRVKQLLKTPKDQLKNLRLAFRAYVDDSQTMRDELGVQFYFPNALPLDEQFTAKGAKQIAYACTEQSTSFGFTSCSFISTHVETPVVKYFPGREIYEAGTIYKKGDLRDLLLSDASLFPAYRQRAKENAAAPKEVSFFYSDWAGLSERIENNPASLRLGVLERFRLDLDAAMKAGQADGLEYFLPHRIREVDAIVVKYPGKKTFYLGTSTDLLQILAQILKDTNWKEVKAID